MKKLSSRESDLTPMSLMTFALSLLSLIIVATSLLTARYTETYRWLVTVDSIICLTFWIQLTADLLRSANKTAYLKHHWIDYLASIPIIEALRFARLFQIFRIIRLLRHSQNILRQLAQAPRETTVACLLLLLTLIFSLGSTFILIVESDAPNATILNFNDALWWVMVTISTVGYGDLYPVTAAGRVIAGVIIISGVTIFGMVAGLVTSSIQRYHHIEKDPQTLRQLVEVQQQLLDNQQQQQAQLRQLEQELKQKKPPQA
ncbi:potassium channel family protein [Thaumasiovibrio sp. DFM-14]|uniref:potassium channel family protein n=1 Tax=Thaumasiovibrio sp. DFM-14 TaxID=3384792 RepID=UPI0039A35B1F